MGLRNYSESINQEPGVLNLPGVLHRKVESSGSQIKF